MFRDRWRRFGPSLSEVIDRGHLHLQREDGQGKQTIEMMHYRQWTPNTT
ncbi:MAG: hypothetical protein AAFQ68_08970 [Bacteroidota bacterium]